MNPKKRAIAKNVSIEDLLKALTEMTGKYVDIEIQQFDNVPNRLIIKPVDESNIRDNSKKNNSKNNKSNIPDSIDELAKNPNSSIEDKIDPDVDEIKDLLDLI